MKCKMTMLLSGGARETISVEAAGAGTDEDVLFAVVDKWHHALTCAQDLHMLRFHLYPSGDLIIVVPTSVDGFTLRVDTRQ